jgi:hypothetical protein
MREFKFIRGKYTDENIFNSDETKACLFAYDGKGDLVQFTEKNNKDFQDKFARLSSDDRISEIYTLRPSQFTVSAKQESSGFDFEYEADTTAFGNDAEIPEVVRNNAESYIKSNTEVIFDTGDKHLPNLNFEDSSEIVKTPTTFKFNDNNNNKEFSKNLIFKITGKVRERGYTTAQGENITAYPKSDGKIDFGGKTGTNAKSGTFNQGILQTAAPTETGTIYRNTATISAIGDLTLAKNYEADSGFIFIKDDKFETDIPYQDGLSFKLYKEVSGYLTAAAASDAATSTKSFSNSGDKYKMNSDGDYERYSSANANDSVQYYLIQAGSSASATKLKQDPSTSPQTYSRIIGNDYYFVDNTTPASYSSLGFKGIESYKNAAIGVEVPLGENKTVGSGKVAFIKIGNAWQAVNSDDTITSKFFTIRTITSGSEKIYLTKIVKNANGTYTATYSSGTITLNNDAEIRIEYFYNNTLLADYREFTAKAENQTMFIKFGSLDKIINKNGAIDGTDYGGIFTPVKAGISISYKIKSGYVAYDTTEKLTELIDGSKNKVYERDSTNEVTKITSFEYSFYYVNDGTAYMLKGDCSVPSSLRKENQFVEGYAASYENYYIFKNNELSSISAEDLSGKTTITYYESDNHHIVGNGVYDDDDDSKRYVMFSENNWVEDIDINSKNTLVNEDNVPSPITTKNVLRLITKVEVNATQSD